MREGAERICPARRARYARGNHFVVCDRYAWPSVWSAKNLVSTKGRTTRSPIHTTKWSLPAQGARPAGHALNEAASGILWDLPRPSLQTARKPNSVLDDHSSTRRITAAL